MTDAITGLLKSHAFTEGLWPEHVARLGAMASEARFRPAGDVLGWRSLTGKGEGKQFQARAHEEVHALAFDDTRLCHACEEDYAFGFWLDAYTPVAGVK